MGDWIYTLTLKKNSDPFIYPQVSHDFAVNFNEENPECAGKLIFNPRFNPFLSLEFMFQQKLS